MITQFTEVIEINNFLSKESWAEEKEIIQSMDPKDQEYAKGSRANIKHHHIHKEDGKPVGFLDLMEDTNNNPHNLYMFIGIDPKYRGKGIFQKLVHNACEWLDGNTSKYKAIMYYIDKNNTASIKAISKVKCFKRQADAYGKVVFMYKQFSRRSSYLEGYIAGYDTFKVNHQTTEYTCGPACVMMVLDYYGMLNGETEASIAKELATDEYSGTQLSAIEYYFKCKGWTVNSSNIEGSPTAYVDFKMWLDYNLSHNNPIMVENKAYGGHWRVIIGFDESNETLLVADPYAKVNGGINVISARDFFTTWYDTLSGSLKAWVTATPPK